MSFASNKRRAGGLGCAGTTSLEFPLIAIAFFFILFAAMDLGRYFLTQHSLRTLTSELARATLAYCMQTGASYKAACNLPANGTQSVASAEAKVPFLTAGDFSGTPSAAYNFNFVLPIWMNLNGTISETTTLTTY
jgi:Flp pilus assembly protein TadG